MRTRNAAKDILLGVAIGDALGVPVEFQSRSELDRNPVSGMRAFGSWRQPAGTWSDDSSLTFCLAEMLYAGYDLQDMANRFINWKNHAYWTAHNNVFDIGNATHAAISALEKGASPLLSGGVDEGSNGNGSLMRILPLLLYIQNKPVAERFAIVKEVSSVTHRHIRSVLACFIYLELARHILAGEKLMDFFAGSEVCPEAEKGWIEETWNCILWPRDLVVSNGYVIRTLQAAVWCLFHTESYSAAVLTAVNLGADTDTTAAVTGGLAGLYYGWQTIPADWQYVLARRNEIIALADRLAAIQ
jgi:ADP-ribosylglycohydrolase